MITLRYISLFSGIECASAAWSGLGWKALRFAEIDPFASALLAHRYPDVPNVGDVTIHDWKQYRGVCDVVIGGSPCQSFSIAGKRLSLGDPRGNLTLAFAKAVNDIEPRIVVWENVPGVLSARANPFGRFLALLAGEAVPLEPPGRRWADAGYVLGPARSIAWRILDAQYFRLAQRRRRVFLVGCPRTAGIDPREILFEPEGLRRDSPPGRDARQEIAGCPGARAQGGGGLGTDFELGSGSQVGGYIPDFVRQAISCKWSKGTGGPAGDEYHNLVAHALRGEGFDASEDGTGRGTPLVAVAFRQGQTGDVIADVIAGTLNTNGNASGRNTPLAFIPESSVRRLIPLECERLQGLPDGYTLIPWRGRPSECCPDSLRYKAIGNGMAAPVIRWIGERIKYAFRSHWEDAGHG